MDAVYVLREGVHDELRYSLRSLAANVEHDRVHLVGHRPPWATGVNHIPTVQRGTKHQKVLTNLRAAIHSDAVSDPFMLWNDDMYAMQPVGKLPVMNGGPLSAAIRAAQSKGYRERLQATRDRLVAMGIEHPLAYDALHVPQTYAKADLLAILDDGWPLWATAYGNLVRTDHGTQMPNAKMPDPPYDGYPWLSSSDRGWGRKTPLGMHVRGVFPTPCRYER